MRSACCGHPASEHYEDTRAWNRGCHLCGCRTPIPREPVADDPTTSAGSAGQDRISDSAAHERRFEILPRTEENPYAVRLNLTWPAAIILWCLALAGAWFAVLAVIVEVHDAVT